MEYQIVTIPINETLEATLQKIQEEGWGVVPGTFPVAIYYLQRDPAQAGLIEMGIDESKITIIHGNGA